MNKRTLHLCKTNTYTNAFVCFSFVSWSQLDFPQLQNFLPILLFTTTPDAAAAPSYPGFRTGTTVWSSLITWGDRLRTEVLGGPAPIILGVDRSLVSEVWESKSWLRYCLTEEDEDEGASLKTFAARPREKAAARDEEPSEEERRRSGFMEEDSGLASRVREIVLLRSDKETWPSGKSFALGNSGKRDVKVWACVVDGRGLADVWGERKSGENVYIWMHIYLCMYM